MKNAQNPAECFLYWPDGPGGTQGGSDPRDFFRVLWRRKWLILLCLILIPLAATSTATA